MSLLLKVETLAKKLGVEISDVENFLHAEADKLLGLAEENIDAAKDVVTSAPPQPTPAAPAETPAAAPAETPAE